MSQPKKILIIRFSSIGDIVLTTPIIRCVHEQLDRAEIHFVTKESFKTILLTNQYVHRIYTFKEDISELYDELEHENYDVVIDLHKNLRSFRLKQKLKTKSYSFNKINIQKFLAVNFKLLGRLPNKHIVDRYFDAVSPLGVVNDNKGLDYFLSENDKIQKADFLSNETQSYIVLVVGGSYATKQIPLNKLQDICNLAKLPVVLLGGNEDQVIANRLTEQFPNLINACGKYSINQSASIVQQAEWVITSDTGMMHIAAAFRKKIISIWGNTIPEFGMGPYMANSENIVLQVKGLECRPCSKLGYHQCPLHHFKCMNEIDVSVTEFLG